MSQTHSRADGDLLDNISEFLRTYYHEEIGELAQKYPSEQKSLHIDWNQVYRYDPKLADDVRNKPDDMLSYFDEALRLYDLPVDISFDDASVRVKNLPELNQFNVGQYRSNNIGELLAVSGQVSKRTKVRPRPVEAAFDCQRCGTTTRVPQHGDDFQEPHECQGCERQGPFRLNRKQSEWEDHQLLRVQQPPEEVAGGQGVHVDVHVADDLVQEVESGDRVTINGIMSLEEPSGDDSTFEPYIDGNAIEVEETDYDDIDIEEHIDEIKEIAAGKRGDTFDLLVNSIAPKVEGMDEIKEALVLQLFGGVRKEYPGGNTDRGNSHILLLGDPGTAKSTLLQAVEEVAPRATFASGKGATAAGMTAAAVSDDFGDTKWSLEAGALVLANDGIACVDEIDKVKEDAVDSMHETLESERVNIHKAGINTTLPARTALLAAGNPKYGRFDDYEAVADQIDLDAPLMSRFDMMFMIDDEPDLNDDLEIIDAILESHQAASAYTAGEELSEDELDNIKPAISADILRAYIAHAKRDVVPQLPDDVKEDVKQWFAELRVANGTDNDSPVPVTFRKLEGIYRLLEASARVRLSNTISHEDFERVKRLVMRSMEDVGMDPESGEFDADVVETGYSKSQRDRIKNIKDLVQQIQDEYDEGAPVGVVVDRAEENGISENKALHEIEKLKQQGELYEPRDDHLRTT